MKALNIFERICSALISIGLFVIVGVHVMTMRGEGIHLISLAVLVWALFSAHQAWQAKPIHFDSSRKPVRWLVASIMALSLLCLTIVVSVVALNISRNALARESFEKQFAPVELAQAEKDVYREFLRWTINPAKAEEPLEDLSQPTPGVAPASPEVGRLSVLATKVDTCDDTADVLDAITTDDLNALEDFWQFLIANPLRDGFSVELDKSDSDFGAFERVGRIENLIIREFIAEGDFQNANLRFNTFLAVIESLNRHPDTFRGYIWAEAFLGQALKTFDVLANAGALEDAQEIQDRLDRIQKLRRDKAAGAFAELNSSFLKTLPMLRSHHLSSTSDEWQKWDRIIGRNQMNGFFMEFLFDPVHHAEMIERRYRVSADLVGKPWGEPQENLVAEIRSSPVWKVTDPTFFGQVAVKIFTLTIPTLLQRHLKLQAHLAMTQSYLDVLIDQKIPEETRLDPLTGNPLILLVDPDDQAQLIIRAPSRSEWAWARDAEQEMRYPLPVAAE